LDHPAEQKAAGLRGWVKYSLQTDSLRGLKSESDPAGAGMGSYDLPTVVKLLEVHSGIAHYLYLGSRERRRPPSEGECKIRLEKLDLDACGLDEPHRVTIRIPVHVGIMKLLPAVKLLGVNYDQ
jgi:hypothetical protein